MTGFCEIMVDVEAGGPTALHPLLSIGACQVDDPTRQFYVELKPVSQYVAIDEAVRIGWPGVAAALTLARLAEDGTPPERAMASFASWIESVAEGRRPVFVAHNAAFDWQFINHYFHLYMKSNPFGIGGLDVPSYWAGETGGPYLDSRMGKLPTALKEGLPIGTHNALTDAVAQVEIFRRMRAGVGMHDPAGVRPPTSNSTGRSARRL